MTGKSVPVSIDLRGLKSLIERKLPHDSPLYKVIVSEENELSVDSFISKSEIWLKLMDICLPS